ncbi:Transmembrane and coiled-coil domain-containing protein 5B [Fukomys damarensis]|uniref:Transmembrane and coiled-coil domain-containing protein 5B n=1 Tax=Fukomys damarensis TaxID=885580 RepID=A0A091DL92_FUKDA|nr:Transmembrane and coiled-coil domain-containing protein 5B [Fukomys damarensis]
MVWTWKQKLVMMPQRSWMRLMMEIANLEATKQNLHHLNSDLEKDLQSLDEANVALVRKIEEKERTIQRSGFEVGVEKASLYLEVRWNRRKEKKNAILNKNVEELQRKVKLQQSTESCAQQEKEMAKAKSDYQFIRERCEDQAHCIKVDTSESRQDFPKAIRSLVSHQALGFAPGKNAFYATVAATQQMFLCARHCANKLLNSIFLNEFAKEPSEVMIVMTENAEIWELGNVLEGT